MERKIVHLPNSELELMMILWEAKEPVTRFYIDERIAKHQTWGVTTILNLLARLEKKGFVKIDAQGKGKCNYYTAIISEDEYLNAESTSTLGRLCSKRVTTLVAALYKNDKVDEKELDELQAFLDKHRKG